jgi:hypothetical protein
MYKQQAVAATALGTCALQDHAPAVTMSDSGALSEQDFLAGAQLTMQAPLKMHQHRFHVKCSLYLNAPCNSLPTAPDATCRQPRHAIP